MSGPGLRDNIKAISPTWFQDGTAEKLLYVIGLMQDTVLDKFDQGIIDRRPTDCDATALPLIGLDRVMPQGPNEPNASYRLRLQGAFDAWSTAGNARSILIQQLAYLQPSAPLIRIVRQRTGGDVWDTYVAGVSTTQGPTHFVAATDNFNWDGTVQFWRAWMIVYSPSNSPWPNEGTWGDGDTWGDATKSWGIGTPATTFTSMRALLNLWKDAEAWYVGGIPSPTSGGIIVSFDSTLFDPTHAAGGGINPDGNWAHFGKDDGAGNYVPARIANARYVDGVA